MSKKLKLVMGLGLLLFALVVTGFLLNYRYCGFVGEMKAFTTDFENTYYWGNRYCPASWVFKPVDANSLKDIESDKDFAIITQKENPEIAKLVEEKYLGYNKFIAEGDKYSFVVYEVNCQSCKN